MSSRVFCPGCGVNQIKHWVALRSRRPSYLRRPGAEVIDGLRFDTEEEWMEACYRHRDIITARQQEIANPEPRATQNPLLVLP